LNELRIVLALERAAARLTNHKKLNEHLIFKGGFVLLKTTDTSRFTRDLDALAEGFNKADVSKLLPEALAVDLDDGLWYGAFEHEDLVDQGEYGGIRSSCAFQIGDPPLNPNKIRKLSRIHIDVGFGDKITGVKRVTMHSILPQCIPISWRVYPIEYVFSEKLQTFFDRGSANSRAKDLYDLVLLFPKCESTSRLWKAIETTFAKRKTELPISLDERANEVNTAILESAWKSVQTQPEMQFKVIWRQFGRVLEDLEKVRPK